MLYTNLTCLCSDSYTISMLFIILSLTIFYSPGQFRVTERTKIKEGQPKLNR